MAKYLLLLRQPPAVHRASSPEAMQAIVEKYNAWRRRLEAQHRYLHGQKLDASGRTLRRAHGSVEVTDGPYTEGKELLAGYFLVEADDYAHALELARNAPHLEYGTIEIREIEPC